MGGCGSLPVEARGQPWPRGSGFSLLALLWPPVALSTPKQQASRPVRAGRLVAGSNVGRGEVAEPSGWVAVKPPSQVAVTGSRHFLLHFPMQMATGKAE